MKEVTARGSASWVDLRGGMAGHNGDTRRRYEEGGRFGVAAPAAAAA